MSKYVIFKTFDINENAFKNLRQLYLPLIGSKPFALLNVFYDKLLESNDIKTDLISKEDFILSAKLEIKEFDLIKRILEAFYLIDSYESKNDNLVIIKLIEPLNKVSFFKNKIFANNYQHIFGQEKTEELSTNTKLQTIEAELENNYHKTSIKYIDFIDDNFFKNIEELIDDSLKETKNETNIFSSNIISKKPSVSSDIEFKNEPLNNKKEFDAIAFLRDRSNQNITNIIEKEILDLRFKFENEAVFKEIFDQAYKLTDSFNWNYVKKIMENLIKNNKTKLLDVRAHFYKISKVPRNNNLDNFNFDFLNKKSDDTTIVEDSLYQLESRANDNNEANEDLLEWMNSLESSIRGKNEN